MASEQQRVDVAVFIDFENVYVSVRDKLDVNPNFEIIMDRIEEVGRVVIARAYADWYRYPRVTSALYANGIEPMYVPTYYYDKDIGRTGRPIKNSVDMNLCIDAMRTLFTNTNISKFVLATGDRDFIPLVNSIRQQGKEVTIIGVGGAASSHLAQSADEFIFYEQLLGKKPQPMYQDAPQAKMPEKGREGYEFSSEREQRSVRDTREPREARENRDGRDFREPRDFRENRDGRDFREARPPRDFREARPPRELPAPIIATIPIESPAPVEQPVAADASGDEVYEVLVQAVKLARERGYVCSFGSLKLLMKELMSDFRESRFKDAAGRPFAKFKDFVVEAEQRGKVQVFTSGTVNEVFLPGEDPLALSQFAQELKEDLSPAEIRAASEQRIDGKAARRRRRRRGGQRTDGDQGSENGSDEFEDDLFDEAAVDAPDALDALDEFSAIAAAEPVINAGNSGRDEANDAAIFAALLDRVEAELTPGTPESIMPPEPDADYPLLVIPAEADVDYPALVIDPVIAPFETPAADPVYVAPVEPTFGEEAWDLLRRVMRETERPLAFQQIHDALRAARNGAGVIHTNEELRSLIKQAINSGMLLRQGKGNRIAYRLAEPAAPPRDDERVAFSAIDTQVFVPVMPELEMPAAVVEALVAEIPAKKPRARKTTPAAEVLAVAETPSETKPRGRRKPATPAAEAAAPEPVATPEDTARKPRGRRKPAQEPAGDANNGTDAD